MYLRKKFKFLAIYIISLSLYGEKKLLTFKEAMRLVQEEHADVKIAKKEKEKAGSMYGQSLSPLLPRLNFNSSFVKENLNQSQNLFKADLSLKLPLIDIKQWFLLGREGQKFNIAKLGLEQSKNKAAKEVAIIFLDALCLLEQKELLNMYKENHKLFLNILNNKFSLNMIKKLDIEEGEKEYYRIESEYLYKELEYYKKISELQQVLSIDEIELVKEEFFVDIEGDQSFLLQKALSSPSIKILEHKKQASILNERASYFDFAPKIFAQITSGYEFLQNKQFNQGFLISLEWNIFNGLFSYYDIRLNRAQKNIEEILLNEEKKKIFHNIDLLAKQKELLEKKLLADEKRVEWSEKVLKSEENRFKQKFSTSFKVSEARIKLFEAKLAHLKTKYDLIKTKLDILSLTGAF